MLASRMINRQIVRPVIRQQLPRAFLSTSSDANLIINAVGEDRLGIVSDIAGLVIGVGGNVGDSQAAKLGSHFSLMMVVSVPRTSLDDLREQLAAMSDMNAAVFEADGKDEQATPQIGYSGKFLLEGADNPGIVHKVTSALAKHGLSIDKMETGQDIAPHGGTVLFTMRGIVNAAAPLAAGFDIAQTKEDLMALGDSLNCEVTVEDVHEDSDASFFAG